MGPRVFKFSASHGMGGWQVFVERARNLPRMDTFGLSDPFCIVSLGKSEKQKTRVVKRNLNPEWNEEFIYK
jgi:Ca2+-dependent lipid-binding protein